MVHDDGAVGPDDLQVAFDDERAGSDAGIALAAMLAARFGIEALVERFVRAMLKLRFRADGCYSVARRVLDRAAHVVAGGSRERAQQSSGPSLSPRCEGRGLGVPVPESLVERANALLPVKRVRDRLKHPYSSPFDVVATDLRTSSPTVSFRAMARVGEHRREIFLRSPDALREEIHAYLRELVVCI